ncbi:MAG TPA: CBS domain-containing protein [Actinomycetota bacterium]|jgi:CBS domain-containing protein|nr:CBS domain-containing protein [Actinomycetota bacterium]
MNGLTVADAMTRLVVKLRPSDTIQETAQRLFLNHISGAPVVEGGRLVGVASVTDLVRAYTPWIGVPSPFPRNDYLVWLAAGSAPPPAHNLPVGDVMTRKVVAISPQASLWRAAAMIDRHGVKRLPVVNTERHMVGIVARADLVRAIAPNDERLTSSVVGAIGDLGFDSFLSLEVSAKEGVITMAGVTELRSTKRLAARIVARVPGVLDVIDELGWRQDDTADDDVFGPGERNELSRAVGPSR